MHGVCMTQGAQLDIPWSAAGGACSCHRCSVEPLAGLALAVAQAAVTPPPLLSVDAHADIPVYMGDVDVGGAAKVLSPSFIGRGKKASGTRGGCWWWG